MELNKRRPEFVGQPNAAAVVLGDGGAWWLPLPWLELRPKFENGRASTCTRHFAHGHDVDELLETIAGSDDPAIMVIGSASIAGCLLKRQYDLTDQELDALLCFRSDDPPSMAWIADVVEIATGRKGWRE